jgi:uncharacterized protein YbaP (TraB family)
MRVSPLIAIFAAALGLMLNPAIAADGTRDSGPAIWRVQSRESTVYLFGSMHILPAGFSWTTPDIEQAMAKSDLFVFEVPVGDAAIAQEQGFIRQNGILPPRQSLRALLTSNEFEVYSSVMRRAGLIEGQYERYRPWLAALVLGLAYLHPDNLTTLRGADDEIMAFARDQVRHVMYFETPVQQLQLLTNANDEAQLAGLKNLIEKLPSSHNLEQDLRDAWSHGDAEGLNSQLDTIFRDRPDAREFLVSRRNRVWLGTINPLLQRRGTTMITVGAAHMGGKNGLLEMICSEGYRVERLAKGGAADACRPGLE